LQAAEYSSAAKQQTKKENIMKKTILSIIAIRASTAFAVAQTSSTTTTTTTGMGTLTTYTPGSAFIVKETSGPVTYSYGDNVTYVTKSGKTLTESDVTSRMKVGIPVSVGYSTVGEKRVISRVEIDD